MRRIVRHMTAASLLLLFSTGLLYVGVFQLTHLFLLTEARAAYGDSYILHDVQRFLETGVIYPDLSQPPYLPTQYGPSVYMFYALPARFSSENPFLGPRLAALAAFFLCIAMVISIAKKLIPVRSAWLWALLMATSITSLKLWPIQIRGDFPGIFLSLATIRLLLAGSPYTELLAGICAGLATQFKITYLASLVAGSLWLLARRQWKELRVFVVSSALASVGMYFLFWLREPRMVSQMLALSPGIRDVPGSLDLFWHAIREPVVLLALPALPLLSLRKRASWTLILLFAVVSFAIACATEVQAGGNINYFYEGLFALIPFSVFGAFRLIAWSRRSTATAIFLTGLILIHFWLVDVNLLYLSRSEIDPRRISVENEQFRKIAAALRGQHIFSTVPRLALLDPHPALVEPFLLSYEEQLGKIDPRPLMGRVKNGEFDVVIAAANSMSWRGIPMVRPDLGTTIVTAYEPHCVIQGRYFVLLPRNRPEDGTFVQKLQQAGCAPYDRTSSSPW
jgi:hypothetical protein